MPVRGKSRLREGEDEDMHISVGSDGGLVYDPDQDKEEKRAIRKDYRALQNDQELLNPAALGVETLQEKVREADRLFTKVKGPAEATLDSAFLVKASSLGAAKARQMRANLGGFDVDDFVAKLITFMGGYRQTEEIKHDSDDEYDELENDLPLNWELIGRKALAKSRRAPAMDFMLGPLAIEKKKRVMKPRTTLQNSKEEERRPQELKEEDIQKSENETTKNVAALEKVLRRQEEPINLFRLIINPASFGQSVENLFYLSFLIRDGRVALDINEDKEPTVYLCEPPTDQDYADGARKKQMVMEFDVRTWERAIEVFNIEESILPTRKEAKTRLGDKWYG